MKKVLMSIVVFALVLSGLIFDMKAESNFAINISVVCDESNDLYKTLVANYSGVSRYSNFEEALNNTEPNSGIMILADEYPKLTQIQINDDQKQKLDNDNIRLYIEYPENNALLNINYDGSALMNYDRAVVVDESAMNMPEYSLLYVHGARYIKKSDISNAWLVNARVAGYDTASFQLEGCTPYAMIDVNNNLMVASTKLSQFISARYAPYERWQKLWTSVLSWVSQKTVPDMNWTAAVHSNYEKDEVLLADAYERAVELNANWYIDSGFVLSETDGLLYESEGDADPMARELHPGGDGSYGIIEAFVSGAAFNEDGSQKMRFWRRADCNGESAGALAMAGKVLNNDQYKTVAYNVANWLLTQSMMSQGNRADPSKAEYGLLAWHDGRNPSIYPVNYFGDDNAKAVLGLISTAAALETDQWDERILEVILANFRTTGVNGFRGEVISGVSLDSNGWEYYHNANTIHYAPHYEALNWATYLWAYDKTGYAPLLNRTKTGIKMMMEAYKNKQWIWTNGLQQERAKMILPLAWLVRIEDTQEHREWLDTMIEDMMSYQDAETGAIRDAFGEPGEGVGRFGPYTSNAAYGTHEAPVIQENGDPCVDALYTSSFAMLSLNEAYNATNDNKYKKYSDSLSDFFVKSQQVSDTHSDFNGVWFRGFDYEKWETYGSDGDAAWGVWATETGWCQAWISNTLSMKALNTNLWDFSNQTTINDYFLNTAQVMLNYDPNELTTTVEFTPAITRPSKNGNNTIIDGIYGTPTLDENWIGMEGQDFSFIIDYQEEKTFDSITLGFLKSYFSGIRVPEEIEVFISNDNIEYQSIGKMGTQNAFVDGTNEIERLKSKQKEVQARYIKVAIKNPGVLPEGHQNQGFASWVFMDEMTINLTKATKSDLLALLKEARKIKPAIYTQASQDEFKPALKEAERVYADDTASEEEKTDAYFKLKDALAQMKLAKEVVSITPATDKDANLLIDDEYSSNYLHTDPQYIGWQNTDNIEVIIDLLEVTDISSLGYSASSRPQWGIYMPNAKFYVSDTIDGEYELVYTVETSAHEGDPSVPQAANKCTRLGNVEGRYIKVVFDRDMNHIQNDKVSEWIFVDEILVNRFYDIDLKDTENGIIETDLAKDEKALRGQNVTLSIEPALGYELDTLKVNDVVVNAVDGTYVISNITEDKVVEATFKPIDFSEEELPIIYAEDKKVLLDSIFDPMKDVRAEDKDGNDISANIEIIYNDVNTSILGNYRVIYQVIDQYGANVEKEINVYVVNVTEEINPEKPDVNDKEDVITGDTSNKELWSLLLLCTSLLLAFYFYRKRNELKNKS